MEKNPTIDWLADTSVFAVNRLAAHSDHCYYQTMEKARTKGAMPLRHHLHGNWKFHYADNPSTRPKSFYEKEFDCSGWDTIQVPGHIQLQGYGKPHYVNTMYPWDGTEELRPPEISEKHNPVGSYVTYFQVPPTMADQSIFVSFQGVETAFFVWVNGHFVGYSEDSFTPAEFELTPFLMEVENKLAVEVYQRSTGSWLEDQDFWRFSGVFRDVYLYSKPATHVDDVHVKTELAESLTNAELQVDLRLSGSTDRAKVIVILEDKDEEEIAVTEKMLSDSKESFVLQVENPALWSAENPYLYHAYIQIYQATGELVEVVPQQVGFRRFEMKHNVMHLNGKRMVFKGVNRHEFNCYRGRSVTKADMLWDIKTLKQNNINAVRTSHYPNETAWYELCDQYGIYVIDEMNLETHGSWQKMDEVEPSWVIPGNRSEWQNIVMDRAVSIYERDKNHPSILIWSCGNESYAGEVLLHVSNYFREQDTSRLVHYEGVFHNRDYNDTSDMESRMYAKPDEIEAYLADNPTKPYISCEYMHAMGNSIGGMKKYTDLEWKYPMYQGGFIWDYIDQGIIKKDRFGRDFIAYGGDFDDRPTDGNFCENGIVYADRRLTPQMQEVRFLYQNIKLQPDRNGVKIMNQNLFTNTSHFVLEYGVLLEGETVLTKQGTVFVAPEEERHVALDFSDSLFQSQGEYIIQTRFLLAQDTDWAPAGFEIAFGEYIFQHGISTRVIPSGKMCVAHGDVNIGIHGEDFRAIISREAGALHSLCYGGVEMIQQAPGPLFWRATTDNDRGEGADFNNVGWFAASLKPKCFSVEIEQEKETEITVKTAYHLSIHPDVNVYLTYTFYADGSVKVHSSYQGVYGLPDLPIHAVSFKIPAAYHLLNWYANGPEENYVDRAYGARLGKFRNRVEDNVAAYPVPQESGNRTGVRWVQITNQEGYGLQVSAVPDPLECTISPYHAFELEHAKHDYELPNNHYTVITVAGKQKGIGGDDSWGAPVHEEFRIKAERDVEFTFVIEPFK